MAGGIRKLGVAAAATAAIAGGVHAADSGGDSVASGQRVEHVTPAEAVLTQVPEINRDNSVEQAIDYLQTRSEPKVLRGRWDLGDTQPIDCPIVVDANPENNTITLAGTEAGAGLKTYTLDSQHFYAVRVDTPEGANSNTPTGVSDFESLKHYLLANEAGVSGAALDNYTGPDATTFGITANIIGPDGTEQSVRIGQVTDETSTGPAIR